MRERAERSAEHIAPKMCVLTVFYPACDGNGSVKNQTGRIHLPKERGMSVRYLTSLIMFSMQRISCLYEFCLGLQVKVLVLGVRRNCV